MPRSWAMLSRTAASSSTMYTAVRPMRSTAGQVQCEDEAVAARLVVLVPNASALRLCQAAADRQPQPHSVRLGREERVENAVAILARHAEPVVADRDLDPPMALGGGDLDR